VVEHRIRCVKQMSRELMLAQSSDWAFLMRNNAARPYAKKRTEDHFANFDALWALFSKAPNDEAVSALEKANPIFENIDWDNFLPLV